MNELAVVVKSIGQSMIHTVQIALRSMDSTVKARETMVFHSVHKPQTALAEQLPFSAMNPPRLVNSSKSSFEDDRDLESLQSLSTIDSTESVHSSASSTSPLSNTSASLPVATSENTPGASQEPNKCRLYHESSKDNRFVIALGMLLAMNSGFNNGVTLSGFLTPFNSVWDREETGGTTGAITKSALALADSSEEVFDEPHWSYFGFTMGIILSFMAGGVISAILNPRPVAWKLSPTYLPAFFIGSCFMVAGAGMAHLEKTEARPGTVCFYFYFIAAANGLANSLSSTFSGNLLRVTGSTGTTTDVSIFLGQLLCGNTKNTWKLKLLSCLLFFYWLGGLASYYAARAWGVWSLSFSAAVYFSLFAGLALHLYRSLHTPILTAIAGLYSWQRLALQTNISDNDGSIDMVLLKQAFEKIDIDGDGFVTLDELCEYLVQCKSGRYNSKAMFEIADRDKKSLLSFQDWKNVLCKEI